MIKNYDIGEYNDIQNFFGGQQNDISQIQHVANISKLDMTNLQLFAQNANNVTNNNADETVMMKDNSIASASNMGEKIRQQLAQNIMDIE